MKRYLLPLIISALITSAHSSMLAVEPWSHTFDFASGKYGWEYDLSSSDEIMATYVGGSGWEDIAYQDSYGTMRRGSGIFKVFSEAFTVTSITVELENVVLGTTNWPTEERCYNLVFATNLYDQVCAETGSVQLSWSGSVSLSGEMIILADVGGDHSEPYTDPGGNVTIASITFTGESEAGADPFLSLDYGTIKPVATSDTYDTKINVAGLSDQIWADVGDNVYASADGEVTTVDLMSSGYFVELTTDNGNKIQYYYLAEVRTTQGADVSAGCVIGTVGGDNVDTPDDQIPPVANLGMIRFLPYRDTYDYKYEWLSWAEPSGSIACGGDGKFITSGCVNYNSNLSQKANGWILSDNALLEYSSSDGPATVSLHYNDTMTQEMVLSPETDYYLVSKVQLRETSQNAGKYGVMAVAIGSGTGAINTWTVEPKSPTQEITTRLGPLTFGEPTDLPDMYNVSITNALQGSFARVIYACLSPDDSAVLSPEYCYFSNYSFDDGNTGWQESVTGVTWHPIGANNPNLGAVQLDPGAYIEAPIDLSSYDGSDAVYRLVLEARLAHNPEGELGDMFDGLDTTINQKVETSIYDFGSITVNNILMTQRYITEFTVTNGNTLAGDLRIENDSNNTLVVELGSVCLNPLNGQWPGDTDDTDMNSMPICEFCSMPTDLNITLWLAWLWCQIQNVWYCYLRVMMTTIIDLVQQGLTFSGYLGRWLGAAMSRFVTWSYQLGLAFGQELKDVALGILATLWNFIAANPLFQALFDLIGYLILLATSGAEIIYAIGNLVGRVIKTISNLGYMAGLFVAALVTAMSASSADLNIPTCTAPTGPYVGMCIAFEVIDAVLTELPTTTIGLAVAGGCIGLMITIWTIKRIGGAFGNV